MDRLSVRVLKYIRDKGDGVPKDMVLCEFGEHASKSIAFLAEEGYIVSGRVPRVSMEHDISWISDGRYSITSKGIGFLEARPGYIFDLWTSRICASICAICAIWGAITGTVAIALEIWWHVL